MTRETKIGLLVGLAFIIVVGILLSDHMAATTELPQAPLETAEKTSHGAVVTPGETRNTQIAQNVITPIEVLPPTPVPTREELTPRQPVNPPVVPPVATNDNTNPAGQGQVTPPVVVVNNDIASAARQHGEEIVPANQHDTPPTDPQPKPQVAIGPKTYTVQAGDNLNKIALKTMGASTKLTRAALLKANPKFAENPDKIVVGQIFVIPSATAPVAPTGVAVLPLPTPKVADKTAEKPAKTETASASPSYFYTVKENDNLWHIAQEQLGNGNAYTAIKELNKDTLKGTDAVRVGMKLRLPAKPLAMAN